MELYKTDDLFDISVIKDGTPFDKIAETFRITTEIVENLSPAALKQLHSGYQSDLDKLMKAIMTETYATLYGGDKTAKSSIGTFNNEGIFYLEKLGETIDEVLTNENLLYFLMNVMDDFELNWHHIEWCDMAQAYKYICLLAARDHGKCLAPETPVRMYDGSIKKIGEIKVGDKVMGPDSKCRVVLHIHEGEDEMFKIKQSRGDDYIVNSRHTLTLLYKRNKRSSREERIEDIDLKDIQQLSGNWVRERYRGFKVVVEYPERSIDIEPYFLGLWLGDGSKHNTDVTNIDKEVINYLKDYALRLGMKISRQANAWKIHNKGNLETGGVFNNKLLKLLRKYELLPLEDNISRKHIPENYLINSRENRLELLAGLMDSNGNKWAGGLHFSNKNLKLILQVKDLCDSLGFRTMVGKRYYEKYDCYYYGVSISGNIHEIPTRIPRKSTSLEYKQSVNSNKIPNHIDNLPISVISNIKIEPMGRGKYVGFTCSGDQRFLLGDGTVTHNSFFWSNGYAAWKLWRYNKDSKRKELSVLGREGWLFSFSKTQATRLLTTLKDSIEEIPRLREKLYPGKNDGWAATSIKCKNGTKVTVGSAGESTRGAHPGWVAVDDFLKDNVMYSSEQRNKITTYFHSVIMNMIQPGGQVIVVGTPFHAQDLYGDLRGKKGWHYREYPSIFPDGRLLWHRRYDYKTLIEKKETQGMINFSREHLCRPVTSDSSIFPFSILTRALAGTQHICMAKNKENFPIKLKRWGIGVDLAISAMIAADYTVFVVGGEDEDGNIWIVNVIRMHGASYQEQIAKLKLLNTAFKPDIIQIESNGFQQIFGEIADAKGNMPIINKPTTAKTKYDPTTGLPGLALLFERGKIKVPHGDDYSVNVKDEMFAELSSVTYTDKGLKATLGHDDIPMAIHQLLRGLSYGNSNFGFSFI